MPTMSVFTPVARRARLLRRHHLAPDAPAGSVQQAARGVLALHATDPATVFLSVLARDPELTVADVTAALHVQRSVVRMMAMRRTVFVVPHDDTAPVVQAAASDAVAATMWRRLATQLKGPTDPPLVTDDIPGWLAGLADQVAAAVQRRGECTATEIAADVPELRTALLPVSDKSYDTKRAITSQVVVAVGTEGRIVRGEPQGGWTSRRHRWEPASTWWPDGLPRLDPAAARVELARRYLRAFGPVSRADVQWWTGWSGGHTTKALAALELVESPDGLLVLAGDLEPEPEVAPEALLLPSLDPTPMGWKDRDWYFAVDRTPLFDRNGNIGPTVWWDGQVIGGWAVRPDGHVVWRLLTDPGRNARAQVESAAAVLEQRLGGAAVAQLFPTPLAKELAAG
jgi:hypothetical protein